MTRSLVPALTARRVAPAGLWPAVLGGAAAALVVVAVILAARVERGSGATALPGADARMHWQARTLGTIPRAAGLAVAPDGRMYVVDATPARGSVLVLDPDGSVVSTLGAASAGRGDPVAALEEPSMLLGVAVDDAGRVYVSDTQLRRIAVFGGDGRFLGLFADALFGDGGADPEAIPGALFHRDGRIYVCDLGRHVVRVFDLEGALVATIGSGRGAAAGAFEYPNGVWASATGAVSVSDTNNNRIQQFAPDGTFLRVVPHLVVNPRGIAGDDQGRLYVASALDHRVLVIGPDDELVVALEQTPLGPLAFPIGLVVDGTRVLVTDRGTGAVQVWERER